MPIPIDQQIEALVEAHDREMALLHLGCSPYDDDLPDTDPDTAAIHEIYDRDE